MGSTPDMQDAPVARLVAAYRAAAYSVRIGARCWRFHVGEQPPDLLRALDADSAVFITAWNPAPHTRPLAQNKTADERLQARIDESGQRRYPAEGSDGRGGSVEPGWVVLDVPLAVADLWAQEFGQFAVLHWQRGQAVRLRMYRSRPDGMADDPHTDWAGSHGAG